MGLAHYMQNSMDLLLKSVGHEPVLKKESMINHKKSKRRRRIGNCEKWMIKPLHGQIKTRTEQVRDDRSWGGLQKLHLKKETENLVPVTTTQDLP